MKSVFTPVFFLGFCCLLSFCFYGIKEKYSFSQKPFLHYCFCRQVIFGTLIPSQCILKMKNGRLLVSITEIVGIFRITKEEVTSLL